MGYLGAGGRVQGARRRWRCTPRGLRWGPAGNVPVRTYVEEPRARLGVDSCRSTPHHPTMLRRTVTSHCNAHTAT
eukprot:125691-Pyramimonas_sp.AAC.2